MGQSLDSVSGLCLRGIVANIIFNYCAQWLEIIICLGKINADLWLKGDMDSKLHYKECKNCTNLKFDQNLGGCDFSIKPEDVLRYNLIYN